LNLPLLKVTTSLLIALAGGAIPLYMAQQLTAGQLLSLGNSSMINELMRPAA